MSAPTATAPTLPEYCYPKAYDQVREFTKNHQLTVLRDDGHYKHLRFAEPGSGVYAFEVITWPGHLATSGDVGVGYMFARVPNMLAFFDHGQPDGHISDDYWAEKVAGRSRQDLRVWSKDAFVAYATETVEKILEYADLGDMDQKEARSALEEVLEAADDGEHEALPMWRDLTIGGYAVEDDWDSRAWTEYDHHLILAMHLILMTARRYHAEHGRQGTGER